MILSGQKIFQKVFFRQSDFLGDPRRSTKYNIVGQAIARQIKHRAINFYLWTSNTYRSVTHKATPQKHRSKPEGNVANCWNKSCSVSTCCSRGQHREMLAIGSYLAHHLAKCVPIKSSDWRKSSQVIDEIAPNSQKFNEAAEQVSRLSAINIAWPYAKTTCFATVVAQ